MDYLMVMDHFFCIVMVKVFVMANFLPSNGNGNGNVPRKFNPLYISDQISIRVQSFAFQVYVLLSQGLYEPGGLAFGSGLVFAAAII
jgi:hypothetical protein